MSKPEETYHFTEIAAILFAFGGIVLAIIQWFLGKPFWDSAGQALMFLISGGLILLTLQGWRSGKLGIKGGDVYRDKNPTAFWAFLIFYVVVSIGLSFVAVVLIFI